MTRTPYDADYLCSQNEEITLRARGIEMTDFYRFPAMAKLNEWEPRDQVVKLAEELCEIIAAERDWGRNCGSNVQKNFKWKMAYGMELMDLIHSAETALRMDFSDDEVAHLHELAIEKNRKRGYYDE